MKFQIVGYTLGILITILGLAVAVPGFVDLRAGHDNAWVFFFNSFVCLFFGGSLVLSNRGSPVVMQPRQIFLLTPASWFLASAFAALPLYMSDLNLRFVDAFFEGVSGMTTTGATVLSGLDDMSPGILVWRSMMQWIGGVGVIAFAIVLLPYLKVGGMQLFRSEASGHTEKVMPRSTEIVGSLVKIYLLLTALCAVSYFALGMNGFDAINHAMTTISTGGFSTHDQSFGHFDAPSLHYAASFFMLLGALPFVLYIRLFFQNRFMFFKDEQVVTLFLILSSVFVVFTGWLWMNSSYTFGVSLQYVVFNVISIVTTTGYASTDYTGWGGFSILVFLVLTYMGACAGSTSGGMKVMRLVIAAKVVARQFKVLLYPNGTFILNYQGRKLDNKIVLPVLGFLSLYVLANVVLTIALAASGVDFETALSGAATVLANVGPGLGDEIGPAGNFANLPDSAKWLLSVGMIVGRLELLTVLVLLAPQYWQR